MREETTNQVGSAPVGAAIYVRVSSTGQLGRDGDEDGYSIPAQVAACERTAADLGSSIVKAYVERAESARSDARPVLQQMLRELPTLGVKYLVVHKVDRLARNRLDDATLYQRLVGMHITLVSASENIDDTPAGRLMHGMLASFAEYYSNNLATEIKKGLTQKHLSGGTPFRPPLGYRCKRELRGNQDIRTVEVDPERVPLVQLAFDLYATGDWSLSRLVEHLDAQGLRSRPTARHPAKALTKNRLHALLRNPYYIGVVVYDGRRIVGRHEPLVNRATFDKVQALLTARSKAGERPSKHEHYLRGSLYCADCGGRLLYGLHSGNGGTYEYFSCTNRAARHNGGRCHTPHYPARLVEKAVEEHYRTVRLTQAKQDEIRADVLADGAERAAVVEREIERHQRAIQTLEDNQARLVQLSYKGLVSDAVLARAQQRLDAEHAQASHLLELARLQSSDVRAALDEVLARTETPHSTYLASAPLERRILNQAFFKRLLIGEDVEVLGVTLTPAYAAVAAWEGTLGQPAGQTAPTGPETAAREVPRGNPDPSSGGQGLLLNQMVELGGLEPPTSWVRSRRSPN